MMRDIARRELVTSLAERIGALATQAALPAAPGALRGAIESSVLAPDDALPPERDLADEFGVSRITVRKAIDGLVAEAC